jgi:L-ectoine synthase
MIVRRLDEIQGTEREVSAETWTSRRLLLADDEMGFSMHDTLIHAGTETIIWYKHHVEAVYCIAGEGEIQLLPDGPVYPLEAGVIYALDGNEKHALRAKEELRMVCVFNPAVTGREVHDADGAYPPPDPSPNPSPNPSPESAIPRSRAEGGAEDDAAADSAEGKGNAP